MAVNGLGGVADEDDSGEGSSPEDEPRDGDQGRIDELFQRLPRLSEVFELRKTIGEGSYSSVYLASLKCDSLLPDEHKRLFAIKHLVPISHPDRIEHELKCLREVGGRDNVAGVELCLRHHDAVVFVMPYLPHTKFSEYYREMDAHEIKLYMKNLLLALRRVHDFNIIHRDVKPGNFLYDRTNGRYLLVDFGLAQTVCYGPPPAEGATQPRIAKRKLDDVSRVELDPKRPSNIDRIQIKKMETVKRRMFLSDASEPEICRCFELPAACSVCLNRRPYRASRSGTQGYRPPEVLLKYAEQTTAVDVWACGVILLSFLSGRYPFFRGADDLTALAEHVTIFGSNRIRGVAHILGRRLTCSHIKRPFDLKKMCKYLRSYGLCETSTVEPSKSEKIKSEKDFKFSQRICDDCALNFNMCICLNGDNDNYLISDDRQFPDEAYDLLERLLDVNPHTRITASDALDHPFLVNL